MNRKQLLSVSFLAAACITFNAAPTWAQTQEKSVGGTQSQRAPDSDTPLPKDSPMSDSGDVQKPSGRSQAGQTQDKSVGGTQSERTPDSDTPLPKDSPMSGSSDVQQPSGRSKAGQGQEKSLGGTQSQRETETGTPLPSGGMRSGSSQAGQMQVGGNHWAKDDVKKAQQALKEAGHDPGPIDGVVGSQTRQAIKDFQSTSGLQQTGTLDAETAQKLGVQKGASASGPRGSSIDRGAPSKGSAGMGDGQSSPSQREPSSPMGK